MPIDTKNLFSNMSGSIICKPIGRIMTNPIMVALLVSIVIMVIVEWSYDEDHRFRTVFRIFSILLLTMFGNNHIIMGEMEHKRLSDDQRDIMNDISGGTFNVAGGDIVRPGGDIVSPEDDESEHPYSSPTIGGLPDVGEI
jgi:hypothetical protein